MEIHYKITGWAKIKLDSDVEKEKVIELLEKGKGAVEIGFDHFENSEWEFDVESEEELKGEKTIELYDPSSGKILWKN